MDTGELLARIFFVYLAVWFFYKQLRIYLKLKARGFYDTDRIGLLKKFYYIYSGYKKAKKDFISEQENDRQGAE